MRLCGSFNIPAGPRASDKLNVPPACHWQRAAGLPAAARNFSFWAGRGAPGPSTRRTGESAGRYLSSVLKSDAPLSEPPSGNFIELKVSHGAKDGPAGYACSVLVLSALAGRRWPFEDTQLLTGTPMSTEEPEAGGRCRSVTASVGKLAVCTA
jgi:hypothetical protein